MFGQESVNQQDPVACGLAAVAEIAAEDLGALLPRAACDRLREVAELVERTEAAFVGLVADWDASAAWSGDEHPTASAAWWLAVHARVSRARASRLLKAADLIRTFDRTRAALATGRIKVGHVEVLARAVTAERAVLYPEHEAHLIRSAEKLEVDWFARAVAHWARIADDQLDSDDPFEQYEKRKVHSVTDSEGGGHAEITFDPEGAALFAKVLDVYDEPDPLSGPSRTPAQRRYDALVGALRAALSGRTRASAADIVVVCDVDTYAGVMRADPTTGRCDIPDTGAVAPETVRRFACYGTLRRLIVDPACERLDLGRSQRLASRQQRVAVYARDRHCQFPGCRRPPRFCQVHHAFDWDRGGATDIDNLCLLCRHHHTLVHEGGWTLHREHGTWHADPPTRRANDPPHGCAA